MPPKNKHKIDVKRSQNFKTDIVALEQQLSRQDNGNSVPQILRKLQIAYNQNKQSLPQSLLHMILRLCGLSELIPRLSQSSSIESITAYVEEIAEKKIALSANLPLLINHKDSFHKEFVQRLSLFFSKLVSDDFPFMKEQKQTKFLQSVRNWLSILSKSQIRNIRYAAIEVMRFFIQSELVQYSVFIRQKQSRNAFQFCKDIQVYLKSIIKDRLKDIEVKIRESMLSIVKKVFLAMENDLVDAQLIEGLFLPLLEESNPKVLENTLNSICTFILESKKLKLIMIEFVAKNRSIFQKISIIPNKNGSLALKIYNEIQKMQPDRALLNPSHIGRIFQFYSLQKFGPGLNLAIQAFYRSIYPDQEQLFKNKTLVLIQLANLINNYESRTIKENIINSFFQYHKIPCEKIFSFQELISTLLSEEYNYQNSQISISDKQIKGWFQITYLYAKFVKQNIQKYEAIQSQKSNKELAKWKAIGQTYNNNLLVNIREIYHKMMDKRASWFVKYYLQLIAQLFLPISNNYDKYVQYLIQKIITLFQMENEPAILKEIVQIFFNLKTYNQASLTSHFQKPHNFAPDAIMIKKLAILSKFYIQDYVNGQFAHQILRNFKRVDNPMIKIQFIVGLFVIHQWEVNSLLQKSFQTSKMQAYKNLQVQIIRFFFGILTADESREVKFAASNILCHMMSIICNDSLQDTAFYYAVSQEEITFIYKFLDKECGLPRVQLPAGEDKEEEQFTMFINNLGSSPVDKQKLIKKLFQLFSSSFKISSFPQSLQIILGTLIKESDTVDLDQTISRMNKSFDFGVIDSQNMFARERLATKYFQGLIDQEMSSENDSKFVYWKIFTPIIKFKTSQAIKEKLINRIVDIYLKKKLSKDQQKQSLNKALLFVIAEFDRIFDSAEFHDLHFIQLMLKKVVKKVTKQVLQRVLAFYRSKLEKMPNQDEEANEMLKFLAKQCKDEKTQQEKIEQQDDNEKQNQDIENEEDQNDKMRPMPRETRSKSKRRLKS